MSRRKKFWQNPAAKGKPDKNQPDVVAALEAQGWSVESLTGEGQGVCDLLVGIPVEDDIAYVVEPPSSEPFQHPPLAIMVEVKMPLESKTMKSRSLSARGLNEKQVGFWERWHGPKLMVRFPEDAVQAIARYVRTVRYQTAVRLSQRFVQPIINKVTGCELDVASDDEAIFRAPTR